MRENLYTLMLLAIVTWTVSVTLARARVFRPVRNAIVKRSSYFGEGITCHYCISHWVTFALSAIYRPRLIASAWPLLDVAVSAFAIIGLCALIARTLRNTPPDGVHPDAKACLENLDELKKMVVTR